MKVTQLALQGVYLIEPTVYGDARGYFCETFNARDLQNYVGTQPFVQDNESLSHYGVIRGLHYQVGEFAQAKLVRVVMGEVLDVAVDLRENSSTFGQHVAVKLSSDNHRALYIPRGFAHGFAVLSPSALFAYKCDNFYAPHAQASLRYDDPDLGIDWGIDACQRQLSDKDLQAQSWQAYLKAPSFK